MKTVLLFFTIFFLVQKNYSQKFLIPDSIKAYGFYTEFNNATLGRLFSVKIGKASFSFHKDIKGRFIYGSHSNASRAIKNGDYIHSKDENTLNYTNSAKPIMGWHNMKVYLKIIKDKENLQYSYYVTDFSETAWKYMGTIITNDTILPIEVEIIAKKDKKNPEPSLKNTWYQTEQGGWKALSSSDTVKPVLRPFSNIDSLTQITTEQQLLKDSLQQSATFYQGLYYTMLKEGNGEQVKKTDTVVIHYKGWLFSNGITFDESKTEPITFPLSRLIPGWQIGVPLCKEGGKIRLYIPSGLAYGIRNVSPKIPPNSTLVFDIEVLKIKR